MWGWRGTVGNSREGLSGWRAGAALNGEPASLGDNASLMNAQAPILSSPLLLRVHAAIEAAGGWLPFDAFMQRALYEPGLGYYARDTVKLGRMPQDGSDFVTAPEMSPWFGRTLARQVAQALQATGTCAVWEFGAGTGALAQQVLEALEVLAADHSAAAGMPTPLTYHIVELSADLRLRQQQRLRALAPALAARVVWEDRLPERMAGVVLANEVLDAMPVKLLVRRAGVWHERGVGLDAADAHTPGLVWRDRPTALRPPLDIPGDHDYLTEIHPQAEAFMRTLGDCWVQGAGFFIDYGFPESEFYHPQRSAGTLMCHQAHRADDQPLAHVGHKDITAHVNFTGVALAAQEAGLDVLGYCSQGRFLINCGLLDQTGALPLAERAQLARLVNEHEMGELFKVLTLAPRSAAHADWVPLGHAVGDRTHTL
jgi:SAM-dependent MidA family methyltransferase